MSEKYSVMAAKELIALRERLELSQYDFGAMLGMPTHIIRLWEEGTVSIGSKISAIILGFTDALDDLTTDPQASKLLVEGVTNDGGLIPSVMHALALANKAQREAKADV